MARTACWLPSKVSFMIGTTVLLYKMSICGIPSKIWSSFLQKASRRLHLSRFSQHYTIWVIQIKLYQVQYETCWPRQLCKDKKNRPIFVMQRIVKDTIFFTKIEILHIAEVQLLNIICFSSETCDQTPQCNEWHPNEDHISVSQFCPIILLFLQNV